MGGEIVVGVPVTLRTGSCQRGGSSLTARLCPDRSGPTKRNLPVDPNQPQAICLVTNSHLWWLVCMTIAGSVPARKPLYPPATKTTIWSGLATE